MSRKPIPVRRLRWMRANLLAFLAECADAYPHLNGEGLQARGDAQTETIRNLWTGEAHLQGWIAARTQGLRRDPASPILKDPS